MCAKSPVGSLDTGDSLMATRCLGAVNVNSVLGGEGRLSMRFSWLVEWSLGWTSTGCLRVLLEDRRPDVRSTVSTTSSLRDVVYCCGTTVGAVAGDAAIRLGSVRVVMEETVLVEVRSRACSKD